jgi:hypothetical protein
MYTKHAELRPVVEAGLFDRHEAAALDLASGCGGLLYRPSCCVGAYVVHMPASLVGRQAVLCTEQPGAGTAGARLAVDNGLRDLLLIIQEDAPRMESLPNGLRLWFVPRRCIEEHALRRQAGELLPWLLDFTFGTRS